MISTKQFFELAQLAEASYAEFNVYGFIEALTRQGMSNTQADALDDNQEQQGTDHGLSHSPNNSPVSGSTARRGLPDFPGTARRPKAVDTCAANAIGECHWGQLRVSF